MVFKHFSLFVPCTRFLTVSLAVAISSTFSADLGQGISAPFYTGGSHRGNDSPRGPQRKGQNRGQDLGMKHTALFIAPERLCRLASGKLNQVARSRKSCLRALSLLRENLSLNLESRRLRHHVGKTKTWNAIVGPGSNSFPKQETLESTLSPACNFAWGLGFTIQGLVSLEFSQRDKIHQLQKRQLVACGSLSHGLLPLAASSSTARFCCVVACGFWMPDTHFFSTLASSGA